MFDLSRIEYCEEWKEGVYAQDELNVRANAPSPLMPQSSVQNGGAYFQEHLVNAVVHDYYVYACHCLCKLIDRSFYYIGDVFSYYWFIHFCYKIPSVFV